jgi:hypothetical protein
LGHRRHAAYKWRNDDDLTSWRDAMNHAKRRHVKD